MPEVDDLTLKTLEGRSRAYTALYGAARELLMMIFQDPTGWKVDHEYTNLAEACEAAVDALRKGKA